MLSERILPSWYKSKLIHQLGGRSTLRFYKYDPQTTNYELQTYLTSLFLQLQIFGAETKTFLQITFLWSHIGLQLISPCNIFSVLQWSFNEDCGVVLLTK